MTTIKPPLPCICVALVGLTSMGFARYRADEATSAACWVHGLFRFDDEEGGDGKEFNSSITAAVAAINHQQRRETKHQQPPMVPKSSTDIATVYENDYDISTEWNGVGLARNSWSISAPPSAPAPLVLLVLIRASKEKSTEY